MILILKRLKNTTLIALTVFSNYYISYYMLFIYQKFVINIEPRHFLDWEVILENPKIISIENIEE